jgi:hypothetical protein
MGDVTDPDTEHAEPAMTNAGAIEVGRADRHHAAAGAPAAKVSAGKAGAAETPANATAEAEAEAGAGLEAGTVDGEAVEAEAVRPRGNRTIGDTLRSLVPLVVLVMLAVWVMWPRVGSRVHVIDPSGDLRDAARIGLFTVESPHGLSSGWQPTSSQLDQPTAEVLTIQIGYLTPAQQYARYVQSNVRTDSLLDTQVPGATIDGSVPVDGRTWLRYRTPKGELALVLPGKATLLVTGSAGQDELTAMASSLR